MRKFTLFCKFLAKDTHSVLQVVLTRQTKILFENENRTRKSKKANEIPMFMTSAHECLVFCLVHHKKKTKKVQTKW